MKPGNYTYLTSTSGWKPYKVGDVVFIYSGGAPYPTRWYYFLLDAWDDLVSRARYDFLGVIEPRPVVRVPRLVTIVSMKGAVALFTVSQFA
jgi:hypothetical protein